MNKILSFTLTIGILITACGAQDQAQPTTSQALVKQTPDTYEQTALYLKSKAELPQDCKDGALAYIVEDDQFVACSAMEWIQIKIRGKDGINGKDGKDGANGLPGINGINGEPGIAGKDGSNGQDGKDGAPGKDGVNGRDGINGINGINGRDGVDGINGRDGINGTNGRDGVDGINGTNGRDGIDGRDGSLALPRVTDDQGNELGIFMGFSVTDSAQHYSVLVSTKRISINISTGMPRALYTVYTGPACTGITYSVIENGWFENTGLEGETGKILTRTGRTLSNITYQSRRAFGSNCSTVSGTVLRASAVTETTLPFSLPVVGLQTQN